MDLSRPKGRNVNDGIEADLKYTSVDEAVRHSLQGRGTWITKLDIEAACRIIPVHPEDRLLLGMSALHGLSTTFRP